MKIQKSFYPAQWGFTLMEVLVAMAILLIGLTSAIALLAAGAASQKKAVDATNSAFLAKIVLEDIKAKAGQIKEPKELWVQKGRIPGYPNYSYDVFARWLDKKQKELHVAISIYWELGAKKKTITYNSILLIPQEPLDKPKK
ncbi:MAG: prepilin-type N-terminal cleavage/methylation domain-containing protein [Planctomycetota bacterium]|nr:MAG: prepilin-type N-terminal cleavage/methylation domain-containing protein [Planctomycetota bacterium]